MHKNGTQRFQMNVTALYSESDVQQRPARCLIHPLQAILTHSWPRQLKLLTNTKRSYWVKKPITPHKEKD